MPSSIKVALIEQSDLFRVSFESYLNEHPVIEVVQSYKNIESVELKDLIHKVDIIIFGMGNNDEDNFSKLARIRDEAKPIGTIAISSDEKLQLNFLLARYFGIHSFFLKNESDPLAIIDTIRFLQNERPLQMRVEPFIKEKLIVDWYNRDEEYIFTEKEKAVLLGILENKRNPQIAKSLGVSQRTVESHRSRIIERTDSKNIIGAIIKAIKWGYLFNH